MSSTFSEGWYQVALLKVALIPTTRVHKQVYRGTVWYVLQDACSGKFFRVPEVVYHFISRLNVTKTVEDGETLDYCGGIEVIHTPGHTPGHACFYLRRYKTLVAGDAMNVMDGKLVGPNPIFTLDMKQGIESLKKLLNYDIETVICYHGGIFIDRPKERILEIINTHN